MYRCYTPDRCCGTVVRLLMDFQSTIPSFSYHNLKPDSVRRVRQHWCVAVYYFQSEEFLAVFTHREPLKSDRSVQTENAVGCSSFRYLGCHGFRSLWWWSEVIIHLFEDLRIDLQLWSSMDKMVKSWMSLRILIRLLNRGKDTLAATVAFGLIWRWSKVPKCLNRWAQSPCR